MVPNHSLRFFLILTLATLACGLASPATDAPAPVPAQDTASAPAAAPGLTVDQLKNAQYQIGVRDDHAVVQLTDGKYQQGTDATTLDFAYIALTDFVAIGDLTGDGVDEIAAMFLENFGGTGNFGLLAIYTNVNGLPVFLTSVLIDDRPMVNSVSIDNGEVFVDAIVHGFDDGGCCPTLPTTRRYALVNNQLRFTNYTTTAPTGAQRIIEITTPANGTEVSGSVQVSGNVSIAPFENNLTYFIYDESGNQYAAGPVAVAAPDLGAPGTFDETFTLEGISAGTTIYLEIQDISAADGSWFAMDAVRLLVK
jgi:hypothetical protein